MRLFGGMLHDDLEDRPELQSMADQILTATAGLEGLVSNLLAFAAPPRGARRPLDLADITQYLLEGMELKLTFFGTEPLDLEIPLAVEHEIARVDEAVRGDTATGISTRAITETGLEVQVPAFINVGDKIRIDTRTGTYVTRV
jgi:hypothetical protein